MHHGDRGIERLIEETVANPQHILPRLMLERDARRMPA